MTDETAAEPRRQNKQVIEHVIRHDLLERIGPYEANMSYIRRGEKTLYYQTSTSLPDRRLRLYQYQRTLAPRLRDLYKQWHEQVRDTWSSVARNLAHIFVANLSANQVMGHLICARGSLFEARKHYPCFPLDLQRHYERCDAAILARLDELIEAVSKQCHRTRDGWYQCAYIYLRPTDEYEPSVYLFMNPYVKKVMGALARWTSACSDDEWEVYGADVLSLSCDLNGAYANPIEGWGRLTIKSISTFTKYGVCAFYQCALPLQLLSPILGTELLALHNTIMQEFDGYQTLVERLHQEHNLFPDELLRLVGYTGTREIN